MEIEYGVSPGPGCDGGFVNSGKFAGENSRRSRVKLLGQ